MKKYLMLFIPLVLLAAAFAVGCGGSDSTTTDEPAAPQEATLEVTLGNMTIQAPESVPAGSTVVTAPNTDTVVHEVVFIKTDTPAGKLPTEANGEAIEQGEVAGEIEDVPPGESLSTTIDLTPGHYALICNLPGHYAAGMYTDLQVK